MFSGPLWEVLPYCLCSACPKFPHLPWESQTPLPPSISHPSVGPRLPGCCPSTNSNNSLFLCSDAASNDVSAPGESKYLYAPPSTLRPHLVDSSLKLKQLARCFLYLCHQSVLSASPFSHFYVLFVLAPFFSH